MARGPVNRGIIAVGVAVPVLAVVVVMVLSLGGDRSTSVTSPTQPTTSAVEEAADGRVDQEWNDGVERAVEPLGEALPALSEAVTSWGDGDLDDAGLAAVLDRVEPLVAEVGPRLDALGPHPEDDLAGPLMADMASLYRHAVVAHRAALVTEREAVATQYDRLGRRLRVLGDRVFDRARVRISVPFDAGPDVELRRPAEVPRWPSLGLAVGSPLEPDELPVDELPLLREEERERQSEQAWLADVEDLAPPGADEVRAAVEAVDTGALGEQARRLVTAAEALRSVPVPDGDRERADRVALGWLLRADAARAAQLDAIDGSSFGTSLAEALVTMSAGRAYALT